MMSLYCTNCQSRLESHRATRDAPKEQIRCGRSG
ncbi:hypothetical protein WDL1CHR_03839 [Variovorax sp. WDL1]|nr:hypothetical protein CHC07_01010 [Variovorax sp. B4]PNG60925.1 hypothetical protein CHC06_00825 [Variovorax sp. B2]VTV13148.1 hypothetical protein WDL1CHR_03839 [Variovorax sp. WDL1]